MEYGRILELIANKCFENDVFQSDYAHKVIRYVRQTYGDELEFLWERFPDNAIFRRKDTGKWIRRIACPVQTETRRRLTILSTFWI